MENKYINYKFKSFIKGLDNINTFDIETETINTPKGSVLKVNCLTLYIDNVYTTFYITEYKNNYQLLKAVVKHLEDHIRETKKDLLLYAHNLSAFDGVFILNHFAQYGKNVLPIMRDKKLIQLNVNFEVPDDSSVKDVVGYLKSKRKKNTKTCKLTLNDSYLMLPSSLRKLAVSFGVENKGEFNFTLLDTPEYKKELKNKVIGPIGRQLIEYNKLDCLVLKKILKKFAIEVKEMFKLNIRHYPTLASLALNIFWTKFYKPNESGHKINITTNEVFNDMWNSKISPFNLLRCLYTYILLPPLLLWVIKF